VAYWPAVTQVARRK